MNYCTKGVAISMKGVSFSNSNIYQTKVEKTTDVYCVKKIEIYVFVSKIATNFTKCQPMRRILSKHFLVGLVLPEAEMLMAMETG